MTDEPLKDHYEIGYRKPPVHSRFQSGVSGNPKGRKAGSKNLATLLASELDVLITVTENGKQKKKAKREVIVAQLVNMSAKSDLRAIALLLALIEKTENRKTDKVVQEGPTSESLSEIDARVMSSLGKRLGNRDKKDV